MRSVSGLARPSKEETPVTSQGKLNQVPYDQKRMLLLCF